MTLGLTSGTLTLYGGTLSSDDERLLQALADQLSLAIDNQALAAEAKEAAALADVDAVRTAMLRAVSHDLRTPLASIKAMVSGLRDSTVAWTPDQIAEALVTVEEETDRLTMLVGNLLDASRLQIGALAINVQPTQVADVVAAALHSANLPAERVRVDIPSDLVAVVSDNALLERSLANIITNAERFSPLDQPVRIEAASIGHDVHLRVVDRGIGIAADDRGRVVQPFQRLGDVPVGDGVGLGLSIAHGFVTAMGGSLTLDDTPGGGLTVTIILPQATDVAMAGAGPMTSVLIVDDERQIRRALSLNFGARGFQVHEAATGESALTEVARVRPDIVLLDLGLPGMSGLTVIEALRGWTDVPIIVLTARDEEHSKVLGARRRRRRLRHQAVRDGRTRRPCPCRAPAGTRISGGRGTRADDAVRARPDGSPRVRSRRTRFPTHRGPADADRMGHHRPPRSSSPPTRHLQAADHRCVGPRLPTRPEPAARAHGTHPAQTRKRTTRNPGTSSPTPGSATGSNPTTLDRVAASCGHGATNERTV